MATTGQFIAARNDEDLIARLIAMAEMKGVPGAQNWVYQNLGSLISTPVQDGQNIADVYAYASETREQQIKALPPLPGVNPGAVTDAHLGNAIDDLLTPETPPSPNE